MVETSETQREELSRYILESYLLSTEIPIEISEEGESVGMLGKLINELDMGWESKSYDDSYLGIERYNGLYSILGSSISQAQKGCRVHFIEPPLPEDYQVTDFLLDYLIELHHEVAQERSIFTDGVYEREAERCIDILEAFVELELISKEEVQGAWVDRVELGTAPRVEDVHRFGEWVNVFEEFYNWLED
jgi:hypothetical protein